MFRSGLIVLTSPLARLQVCANKMIDMAAREVEKTLYVHVLPGFQASTPQIISPPCDHLRKFVINLYASMAASHSHLDVRILLNNIVEQGRDVPDDPYSFHQGCNVVWTETNTNNHSIILDYIKAKFPSACDAEFRPLEDDSAGSYSKTNEELFKVYDHVCLGGTFDRIHAGHKILLTHALLMCNKSLTVGVTDGEMNTKKTLYELIASCDSRIGDVRDFVEDVKPYLEYKIVPINDPFGPSIVDPQIECLVVSEETIRGGEAVNKRRLEKGLSKLDIEMIGLVEDPHHSLSEEAKISSSSMRRRLLGTLLRPPQVNAVPKIVHTKTPPPLSHSGMSVSYRNGVQSCSSASDHISSQPYIIGLTGGIASGKTSVCKRLEKLGAGIINCDQLGHKAYEKGTQTLQKVVDAFGADVLDKEGNIDRKVLGPRVFKSPEMRGKLNGIVWPAIADLAREEIGKFQEAGKQVVILDAAVLLEAGWDKMVHEVWSSVIDKKEALKRIMDRDNITETNALNRIESQISNQERVSKSNVVFCTQWEYEYTQLQVEQAWQLLAARIK